MQGWLPRVRWFMELLNRRYLYAAFLKRLKHFTGYNFPEEEYLMNRKQVSSCPENAPILGPRKILVHQARGIFPGFMSNLVLF